MKSGSSSPRESDRTAATKSSDADRTLFDWARHTGTTEAVLQEMETQVRLRRRRRKVRGAAVAVALLLLGGFAWQLQSDSWRQHPSAAAPVAALPNRQVLPDGSVAVLRAGAVLQVEYSAAARRVILTEGEALFEVVKIPARPFVVRAAGVDVRAVGTTFVVNRQPATVEVLVTEGEVAVETPAAPSLAPATSAATPVPAPALSTESAVQMLARVPARNRVVVDFALPPTAELPAVLPVSDAEINERLAWRIARLQFSRTPLVDAIAMINQHSRTRLVLESPGLEHVRLSGAIRADNVEALLQLLEADHGITAEHRGETEIVLRKSR